MKIYRLISGILSIVLFVIVTFQSCAVGVLNALDKNQSTSGSAGIIVAILMLTGGIVSIVLRNSENKSGNISLAALFGLGALVGFFSYGNYKDLVIWSLWCLANTLVSIVDFILKQKKKKVRHIEGNRKNK